MNISHVISAAGGNNTAIIVLEKPLSRKEYEDIGLKIVKESNYSNIEQVGFLIPTTKHFEMSGGEFCGNAARSAAFVLSKILDENQFSFTISGFDGEVKSFVIFDKNNQLSAKVSCYFYGLKIKLENKKIDSKKFVIVDLGGIVHCVLYDTFPKISYQQEHIRIITKLDLLSRPAVCVLWLNEVENGLEMDPVVWVKSIDTFFYETSCGSGSIAASVVSGSNKIIQPTGQVIEVEIDENGVKLISKMEEIIL